MKILIQRLTSTDGTGIIFNGEAHPLALEVRNTYRMDRHKYDDDELLHYATRQLMLVKRLWNDCTGVLLHHTFPRESSAPPKLTVTIEVAPSSLVMYAHYNRTLGESSITDPSDPVQLIIRYGDTGRDSANLFVMSLDELRFRFPDLNM